MNNQFSWLPNSGSWFRAIAITLLILGLQFGVRFLLEFLFKTLPWLPIQIWYGIGLLVSLAPIVAIAVAHNGCHRFLDQVFPETRLPDTDIDATPGIFPGLVSWWEGLYGWLAGMLSSTVGSYLLGIILPLAHTTNVLLEPLTAIAGGASDLFFWYRTIVQIVIAAYIYQMESLMRQRLMSARS